MVTMVSMVNRRAIRDNGFQLIMVATGWKEIGEQAKRLTKSTPFKDVRTIFVNPKVKACIISQRGSKPTSKSRSKNVKCKSASAKNLALVQSFADGTTMMSFEKPTLCGYSKLFDTVHCPPLKK